MKAIERLKEVQRFCGARFRVEQEEGERLASVDGWRQWILENYPDVESKLKAAQ